MQIALLTIELFIPLAHTLKEKRSAVRSLKDQIGSRFNASVAEIGYQDKWQRSLIGVCMLNGDKHKLEVDAARIRQLCEEASRIDVVEINQEWL